MEYVTLGNTGLKISRVGFGGIPIQRIDEQKTVELFKAVEEAGINYIDTARGYTVSEEYIGAAIAGKRDKFILATKSMSRTREAMEKDIAISCTNLRTDYIDLYQIHNPSLAQFEQVMGEGGALEALLAAKKAGKIGHIGVTAHAVEVFERALDEDWVETIMFPYNIVETQGKELIDKCAAKGKGFIAMKPLAGGAIEDAKLAMRFLLSDKSVTVVIPGMYNADEVAENTSLTGEKLTDSELAGMDKIRASLTGNFCRRCNYCAPCTVGINISGCFLFAGYFERYGLEDWAKDRYGAMKVKASACIGCGECEKRCPYGLPIREMLAQTVEKFGE